MGCYGGWTFCEVAVGSVGEVKKGRWPSSSAFVMMFSVFL